MAGLAVEIVTPARVAWKGEAAEVQAPGEQGEFGVLPGHTPMLAVTLPGIVTLHGAGAGPQRLVVGEGFAEVGPDRVTLLVSLCEEADKVDKEAAKRQGEEALERMSATDPESEEGKAALRDALLARARLQA